MPQQGNPLSPSRSCKSCKIALAASLLLASISVFVPSLQLTCLPDIHNQWAMADSGNLDSLLKNWAILQPQELAQKLEEFRSVAFQSEKQKQRAAYVLARLLQKSVQSKTEAQRATIDPDNVDKAKKIISLYEEASKVDGLWERSQHHIVEVATAAQLEPELRAHLELLKGREKNPADKNAD